MTQKPITVLLVDDQKVVAEGIKQMIANENDIELHYCQDPSKAIETAEEVRPTVILQDLVMPEIDGLLLVKYYRANPLTKQVPMVVLSAEEQPKVKAEAFSLGANDYLVKLPAKEELIARLRYHSDSYNRLIERNQAYCELQESQDALKKELNDAADYVRAQLPSPGSEPVIETAWRFIPSEQLGGDSFGYHWLDERYLAIYILDVCGHGVRPALLSCTVNSVLKEQTLNQVDYSKPVEVLKELNQKFRMEDHRDMFFTAWYGVYDKENKTLNYSSGGHPPALIYRKNSELIELSTPGLVIGAMSDSQFAEKTEVIQSGDQLFIYTDGVYELTKKKDNTLVDIKEFFDVIKTTCSKEENLDKVLEEVVDFAKEITGSDLFPDDFSIVALRFQ